MTTDIKMSAGWMQTFTGKVFYPLDPVVEDIEIEDIAHSLALQCRFAGHCKTFYSVGQHSLHVADLLAIYGPRVQLAALLHDAAEAYLVDLPRPVKMSAEWYRVHEKELERCIAQRFDLISDEETMRLIKKADNVLLATEKRDLMGECSKGWELEEDPLVGNIQPLSPVQVKGQFLEHFKRLSNRV